MSYRDEFPDFTMDVAIPASWRDDSWHNDSCPSFIVASAAIKVWVDYADRSRSEWPGHARFMVSGFGSEGSNSVDDVLLESDDWAEVLAFVVACTQDVEAKFAAGTHIWACNGCGQRYGGDACPRCGNVYRFLQPSGATPRA